MAEVDVGMVPRPDGFAGGDALDDAFAEIFNFTAEQAASPSEQTAFMIAIALWIDTLQRQSPGLFGQWLEAVQHFAARFATRPLKVSSGTRHMARPCRQLSPNGLTRVGSRFAFAGLLAGLPQDRSRQALGPPIYSRAVRRVVCEVGVS